MKKTMLTAWLALFVALSAAAQPGTRVLPMTLPDDAATGALHIDLRILEALSVELAAGLPEVEIALLDDHDALLVKLGRVRNGKCKWSHKSRGGSLDVGLAADARQRLAESIAARSPRPGYKLATFELATGRVLSSVAVAFSDFADLSVQLQYPIQVAPGQDLGPDLSVQLENLGSAAARDIVLEIVLSTDDRIPRCSAPAADSYAEDSLLAGGREAVPLLEPGQKLAVAFRGPLRLPADLPADKSYLAVVADPEDRIAELSEENNVHCGFILNNVPEPKSFTLEMPDTQLHFEPASYGFRIESAGSPLSDGKDWRLCRMKPSVYQIKQAAWEGFFWEIDTAGRQAFEIRGAAFCKPGGSDHSLAIKVRVQGGSLTAPPARFTLELSQTTMRFEPAARKFELLAHGRPIFYLPFWKACKLKSYLFQLHCTLWQDQFWQVDTYRRTVSRIRNGTFGSEGGEATQLPLTVRVEP